MAAAEVARTSSLFDASRRPSSTHIPTRAVAPTLAGTVYAWSISRAHHLFVTGPALVFLGMSAGYAIGLALSNALPTHLNKQYRGTSGR